MVGRQQSCKVANAYFYVDLGAARGEGRKDFKRGGRGDQCFEGAIDILFGELS